MATISMEMRRCLVPMDLRRKQSSLKNNYHLGQLIADEATHSPSVLAFVAFRSHIYLGVDLEVAGGRDIEKKDSLEAY